MLYITKCRHILKSKAVLVSSLLHSVPWIPIIVRTKSEVLTTAKRALPGRVLVSSSFLLFLSTSPSLSFCCSSKMPSMFLVRSLFPGCFLCLVHTSLRPSHSSLLYFIRISSKGQAPQGSLPWSPTWHCPCASLAYCLPMCCFIGLSITWHFFI